MDADMIQIIIFLVVAAVLLIRLKDVLGTKTGEENTKRSLRVMPEASSEADDISATQILKARREKSSLTDAELHLYAPAGSLQETGIRDILKDDTTFDPKEFIEGSKYAYEMLLTAFSDGDTQTLKDYVSTPVYEGFVQAIEDRKGKEHTFDSKFIGVRNADITEVDYEKDTKTANITVRFIAERTYAVRDATGEVIEGNLVKTQRTADEWTFTRRVNSTDPNWILTATG